MSVTTTDMFDNQALLRLINAVGLPGLLATPKMGLIVGTPQMTKRSVIADITQPTFPGYALKDCPFSAVVKDANNRFATEAPMVIFQPTDGTAPATVNGYFLQDDTGDNLWAWEFFPSPQALRDQFDRIGIVPQICLAAPPSGVGQFIH